MADDFSLNAKITADNSGFTKAINQCNSSLGGLGKSLSSLKTLIGGAFAVKTLQTFTKQLNECSRLYIVQAKAEKNLETAAKNNPYLKPENVKQLKSYASQLQSISEIGDEQLLPLMGQLASAGRTQEEIQSIMSAALDASASGAMSLEQAVKSLNMTYSGTAGRLTMVLPNIKNLTEEELKQGKAVEMVANAYKGIAKETASSSKQLANSIGDLKEEIGYGWESALSPMRRGLQEIIDKWSEALRKAREAKAEMTNLENVKVGRGGDIGQASKTQTNLLIQQKIELDEYIRFAQLSAKKKKELTKAEQKELYDLRIKYLDNVRALYQGEGETDLQAIQKAVSEKTIAYQKSFEEEKQIVAQHQQELAEQENARTESERQARQNRLNDLRSAFDAELAEYRQEIELRKKTGEEITEEQEKLGLLTIARSAYIKMIQASNGEMREDAERLQIIIDLMAELKEETEELNEVLDVDIWGDFQKAIKETQEEIEKMATDWTPFFKDTFRQFGEIGKGAFEAIGQSLAGNADAWDNYGAKVLEIIAQILEGLAAQLSALAVQKAMCWSYGEAAVAAAGAAAALVSAGALKAVSSNMKSVSKETQTLVDALKDLKNELNSIESAGSAGKISNIAKAYAQSVNAVKEAQSVLSQKATSETYEVYLQSLKSYSKSVNSLDESLNELNDTLDLQAIAFRKLYSATDSVSKNIVKNKVLLDLKAQIDSAYSDLENIGKTIGETMFNGIAEGASSSNFLTDVKKYITNAMTKIAVFTESFQKQLVDATSGMLVGITTGDDSIIENSTKAIKNLYETALSTANAIEGSITGIFNNIDTKTKATVRSLKETIDEISQRGFADLSQTLKDRLSLSNKLDEAKTKYNSAKSSYENNDIQKSINELKEQIQTYQSWIDNTQSLISSKVETVISYQNAINKNQKIIDKLNRYANLSGYTMSEGRNAERNIEYYKELIQSYQESIAESEKYIKEINAKITSKQTTIASYEASYTALYSEYKSALKNLTDAQNLLNESMTDLLNNLKTQNKELDNQILLYKELYTPTDASFNSVALENSLNKIKSAFYSFFEDLQNMGLTVGETLVNSIAEGMSQADFLGTMKDYIRKMVIQTVVYTDAMQQEIASIGQAISKGIAEGFTDTGLQEIKRDLSYIFDQANKAVDKVDSMFGTVFSGYATGTQNATAGLHLVGEAGPELVRFRGGEQVLNAGDTQKALSGAGTTINQNVTFNNLNDTSAFAMMQQFKHYNREMAINGVF